MVAAVAASVAASVADTAATAEARDESTRAATAGRADRAARAGLAAVGCAANLAVRRAVAMAASTRDPRARAPVSFDPPMRRSVSPPWPMIETALPSTTMFFALPTNLSRSEGTKAAQIGPVPRAAIASLRFAEVMVPSLLEMVLSRGRRAGVGRWAESRCRSDAGIKSIDVPLAFR